MRTISNIGLLVIKSWNRLRDRTRSFRRFAACIGVWNTLRMRCIERYNTVRRALNLEPFYPVLRLKLPGYCAPVYLRWGTSDYASLTQIFFERVYAPVDEVGSLLVIDCGANVGYASLYFLTRHPNTRVIAIEPDPENAAMCRRNLAAYGNRATVLTSAVWSRPADLVLLRGAYRDGGAWATQVREPHSAEEHTNLQAIDLPTLIELGGGGPVDLLKVDIEQSELAVFRGESMAWLSKVRNIAIELHDQECKAAFFGALKDFDFTTVESGDLTICCDIRAKLASPAGRT